MPGEFHRQRSLAVDYNPWGYKESDTTEWLAHIQIHTHTHTQSWNKLKHNIPTFGAAAKVMLRGKHIGLYILSMVKIYNDLNLRTYKLKILT